MEKGARLVQLFTLVLGCAGQRLWRPNNLSLLPRDPLIHLGDPVQFNCSMSCPRGIFTWKGLDAKSGNVTSASHYSLLSITSTAVHHEGRIICEGACQGQRMQKTSQLNLYSLPNSMRLTQHPAHLICSIRGVYPLDALVLSWYQGEHKLQTPEQQDISDEDDERDEVQSYQLRLDLPEGVAIKGTTYRCEAELHLENATFRLNKTKIFGLPAGTREEQSTMEMASTKDTPSTKSVSIKQQATTGSADLKANPAMQTSTTRVNPTTEAATTRLNPTTDTAISKINSITETAARVNPTTETATTRLDPTTETAAVRLNPRIETETARLNPTTETETARLNPTTETETARLNPTTETATATLNPTTETETTTLNPTTETAAIRVNPTSQTAATRVNPTSQTAATRVNPTTETVKNKDPTTPGTYGIKNNRLHEINQTAAAGVKDTSNTKLKPVTARELYTATTPDANPKPTATLTISPLASPTTRAPPKRGVDTESVAFWSMFSVLGLLSSSVVLHQLWKRLSFLSPKKGSFELGHV